MSDVKEPEVVQPEPDGESGKKKGRQITRRDTSTALAQGPAPGSIEDLMAQAVSSGNMDTIERVFALRNQIKAEQAKEAYFSALAKFQSLVPDIPKRKKGYGYFYAPIGDIDKGIKKAMDAAGLSKRWVQVETAETVTISCVVTHTEGHSELATIGPVGWDLLEKTERMNSLQHRAAVISYLQRYTMVAALGIATTDDTDGANLIIPEEARKQRQPVSQPSAKPSHLKKVAEAQQFGGRPQLEPVGEGEAIDAPTVSGLVKAMERAALGNADFTKRFPGLSGLEQVKKTDSRVVMSWIADPVKN